MTLPPRLVRAGYVLTEECDYQTGRVIVPVPLYMSHPVVPIKSRTSETKGAG